MVTLVRATAVRSQALDVIRFFALTLIVAGHVWTDYPLTGYVAIFFVITGYLWKPGRTTMQEARHKWNTLVRPYLAWGALLLAVVLAVTAVGADDPAAPARRLLATLWGGARATEPFTAYWFLTAMFFACIAYRFVTTRRSSWPTVALVTASILGSVYIGSIGAALPLGAGHALWAIQFLAAGHLLQIARPHLPAVPIAIAMLAGGLLLAVTGAAEHVTFKTGDFGTPFVSTAAVLLVSCGVILLADSLGAHVPDRIGAVFTNLVLMSTPVLLLHAVPIWMLRDVVPDAMLFLLCLALPIAVGTVLLTSTGTARTWLMPGRPTAAARGRA